MIERALAKYNANPNQCFLIGDNQRDVQAAHAAGVMNAFEIQSNDDWEAIAHSVD